MRDPTAAWSPAGSHRDRFAPSGEGFCRSSRFCRLPGVYRIFHTSSCPLTPQADLPFKQRQTWVNRQANAETKREIKVVWDMFKKDPLSPINVYFSRYVVTGMGMFTEGYTIL